MFSLFICACGTTHLIAIWTIWEPVYWLDAFVRGITAVLSVITAIMLWRLIPVALKVPSAKLLTDSIEKLQLEVIRRHAAEQTLKQLNAELDAQVVIRTEELTKSNHMLRATQQRIERKIQEVTTINQELNNFSYVASHDLKSPLRGIDQLATWIAEDLGESINETTQDHLRLMRNRIKRMEVLLDDLLAYSRVGRSEDEIMQVDTRALVNEIFDLSSSSKIFHLKITGQMPVLSTRKVPLEVVFRNLISNAIRHHDKADGRIEIGARELPEGIEFSVKDNGPGIPPEHHQRVFTMFQTLKPRDVVEGSGIGLALVKKIVESQGGKVALESDGINGCVFRFIWPKTSIATISPAEEI